MKKIILAFLAALALLATPTVRAWTYTDGDLLLIFRESGFNDVEFDLGSVSNLLGQANGSVIPITGWDASLVTGQFGTDLTGVSVVLLAVTSRTNASPTAWLTSIDPNVSAYRPGSSDWNTSLYGAIHSVGSRPVSPVPVATAGVNAYSLKPTAKQAYDYLVSGGSQNFVPQLGGNAPFTVEQVIPGQLDFWAIQPASQGQSPDTLVGTFTITADGVLNFIPGPRPSTITSVSRSGNVSTVAFTTTIGNLYSLSYANSPGGPAAAWPVDGTTVVGDGQIDTLSHTNSGSAEFYRITTH